MAYSYPVYVAPHVPSAESRRRAAEDISIDFFCKTTEDKTKSEIKYCNEFYIKQKNTETAGIFMILWGIIILILFASLLNRFMDGNISGWAFTGICLGVPSVLIFTIVLIFLGA